MMLALAENFVWHSPSAWWLLLVLLLPFLILGQWSRRQRPTLAISSTEIASQLPGTWRTQMLWIPPVLRLLAITALIFALARPQLGNEYTVADVEGIAIQLVVDRSGSMQAIDFRIDDQPVDRLVAVKHVARRFVEGDGTALTGRRHDLIGLISFARYADQDSPLTLDHGYLLGQLDNVTWPSNPAEDGTAIGDGLGLAVERLLALDREHKAANNGNDEKDAPEKVIILLTDGENNAGDLDPLQAARMAQALGIRLYTIGVGTTGRAPFPTVDPRTGQRRITWHNVAIDEAMLREMARITGGEYFPANDIEALEAIYNQIDEFEKTQVQEQRFMNYRELALRPWRMGWFTFPPLVLLAFGLLAVEITLRQTLLRRVP